MGGTMAEFGGRVGVTYFSDDVHGEPRSTRLAAAIAWRKDGSAVQKDRKPLWQVLSLLFRSFRKPKANWSAFPNGWSGGAGEGEDQILYDSNRRVVRVRGREFALPTEGRTLILLVDEAGSPPRSEPMFTMHSIEAPIVPHASYDPHLDKSVNLARITASHREEGKAWREAIRREPAVSEFLDRPD
jgi:hypothetical protein